MEPKELLRRYLEQRRELGETEFVLDRLTVDEAMTLLGARGGNQPVSPVPRASKPAAPSSPAASEDWRQTLRAAGADAPATQTPAPAPAAPPEAGIVADGAAVELFGGTLERAGSLGEIAAMVAACTRCPLYATATNPVPGEGDPNADLMVVGEAPGQTEDETGRPFVGAAGQLLTKILAAINLAREDVFIVNVLKHRPPGNRNPKPEEVVACGPYLVRQIELVRPKVILALGTFAAQTLLDTKLAIGKLRGQVHRYHGVPLIVTYHPAALLRNPAWKRPTWEDVQLARRILDSASAGA